MAEQYSKESQRKQVVRAVARTAAIVGAVLWSVWPHRYDIVDAAFEAREAFWSKVRGDQPVSAPAPENPNVIREIAPGAGALICRNVAAIIPLDKPYSKVIVDPAINLSGEAFPQVTGDTLTEPLPVDAWFDLQSGKRVQPNEIPCHVATHLGTNGSDLAISDQLPAPGCGENTPAFNWRKTGGYAHMNVVHDAAGEGLLVDLAQQQNVYDSTCATR